MNTAWKIFLLIFLCFTAFAGQLSESEMNKRLERFGYDKRDNPFYLRHVKNKRRHRQFEGSLRAIDPINGDDFNVSFGLYRSKKSGKKPLIVIMPSIEGEIILERDVARYFANRGYVSIIARLNQNIADPNRKLKDVDDFLIRSTTSIQMLIDYALRHENADPSKISAFGVSLGGIRTSLLLGVDLRVKSAVVIVGGGNIPQILTNSTQKIIAGYRRTRMVAEGISHKEQYHQVLKDNVTLDPIYFASRRNPEDLMMLIGKYDDYVPTYNQYQLWRSFDYPTKLTIPAGHVLTAMGYRLYLRRFRKFYTKSYSERPSFFSSLASIWGV